MIAPVPLVAPFPAFATSDELAVVLQFAAAGALAGTAIAARRRRRDPDYDAWLLTARWTLVAAAVGLGLVLAHWLGWW